MNRIMILFEFLFVIVLTPPVLMYLKLQFPELYVTAIDIWKPLLAAFGVHLAINAFKKK